MPWRFCRIDKLLQHFSRRTPGRSDDLRIGRSGMTSAERWLRVVLHRKLREFGGVFASERREQGETEVDSGSHATACVPVSINDDTVSARLNA